jgi:hypothetical protein
MTERPESESNASPFEPMLRGQDMPKVLMEEFMLPLDGSHDVLLEGSMERVWSVRWARPLLRLLARWDVLFSETGTNVPTTMHIFVGPDRAGRLGRGVVVQHPGRLVLGVAFGLATEPVDRLAGCGGGEPSAGIGWYAVARPSLHRDAERLGRTVEVQSQSLVEEDEAYPEALTHDPALWQKTRAYCLI